MDIKLITSELEKTRFLKEYNRLAGMKVPIAYVLDAEVYGAFIDDVMVGGFAFALGEDMAWPQVLPAANGLFDKVPKSFCLEINLVWASGSLHASFGKMIQFWLTIVKTASSYRNIEYITYAVDVRRQYLVAMYERLASGKLFEGEVPKYPGRKAAVYYTTPFRCKLAKLLCCKEYLIRFQRYINKNLAPQNQVVADYSGHDSKTAQSPIELTDQLSAG